MKAILTAVLCSLSLVGCSVNTETHSYYQVECDALVNIYSPGMVDGSGRVDGLNRKVVGVSTHWGEKTYRVRDVTFHGMVGQDHVRIYQCVSGNEYVLIQPLE